MPGEERPEPTEQKAGWAPEPSGRLGRQKCLAPAGIRTLNRPCNSEVTTPTSLSGFQEPINIRLKCLAKYSRSL